MIPMSSKPSGPRGDSEAKLIPAVYELNDEIMALGGGAGTKRGTGGMQTKLRAAKIATEAGCDMIIANGANPENIYEMVEGGNVGTRFYSAKG